MKYLAVINPISGDVRKKEIERKLKDRYKEKIKFIYWKSKDFDITAEVEKEIAKDNYNKIIICGGDGTINRISKVLINKNIPIAIIPVGSGNGLARALKIPINVNKAIELIDSGRLKKIDAGLINNTDIFLCTFGIGFDACVAHEFSRASRRGVFTYFKKVIRNVFLHNSQYYKIIANDKEYNVKAFFVNIANINQWGFNIKVAPNAILNDGLLDVTITKKFNYIELPYLFIMLLIGKLNRTHRVIYFKTKDINILPPSKFCHYDGEAVEIEGEIRIKVVPECLTFIVP